MLFAKDYNPPSKPRKIMESIMSSPVFKSFLAGSFSGTCSTVLFQPLDLVKTRIQMPVAIGNGPVSRTSMLAVFNNVMRNEKISGLWRGLSPSISRTVPGVGLYFSCLHWLKTNVASHDPSSLELLCLGACARSIAGAMLLPFTVVKTRFESGRFEYRGVLPAIVDIYRAEGARGLYSGLAATLLRDAPFSGLYFMFYTQTKKLVPQGTFQDHYLPVVHFSCGVIAGCLASMATQPADVVKTHMQIYPKEFGSLKVVILHIYKRDGPSGFIRGIVPRTVRRTLMAAMAWTVYEQVMKSFAMK